MTHLDPGHVADLAQQAASGFANAFGAPAATVGRAPGRVNLIGEHTDYNAGLCLPLALPHATYAACAVRDDDVVRIGSALQDDVWSGRLDRLGPGQVDGWPAYVAGVLWALREAGHAVPGLDVYVVSTVPLGAGLSSSAAIECAVAVAVAGLIGLELTASSRAALVAACMRAETEVAGAPTGGMDQTIAMLGRAGSGLLIDFADGSTTDVPLHLEAAGLALLVTDTRVAHALNDGGYAARRADCEAACAELDVTSLREVTLDQVDTIADGRVRRRARHVVTENGRVADAVEALRADSWSAVGGLLTASHVSLRDDYEVSCVELDAVVDTALRAGALGSRMTGGGFGGSAVSLLPAERLLEAAAAIDALFAERTWTPPVHLLAGTGAAGAATIG